MIEFVGVILAAAFGILGIFAFFALAVILRGLVLSVLWGWFIVPVFGLPVLGILPAFGVALIVTYLVGYRGKKEGTTWLDVFTGPLITLVFGWIVHLFM